MAIGTGIGLAIAGIAGAVGGGVAAKKQADAAQDATTAEQQATNQALAVQERMYTRAKDENAPWLSAGNAALGQLQTLSERPRMTFDPNNPASWQGIPKPNFNPSLRAGPQAADTSSWDTGGSAATPTPGGGSYQGGAPGQLGAPGSQGGGVQAGPGGQVGSASLGQPGSQQGPSGRGMVLMEKDGQRKPIPQQFVQKAIQAGARVVQS